MKRSTIRLIVIIGTISIIGIIVIQIYWIQQTFTIKEKQFNQSVTIALRNVAQILFDYNNDVYEEACGVLNDNPVQQLSANYYVVNVNCGIDADILEHYLRQELTEKNINLDFEYGIYDCSSDEMVYGNYVYHDEEENIPEHHEGMMISSVCVHESYDGASNGEIDLIISGGKPPYIYMWSNGYTTEDIDNLSKGVYIVTITDNDNCLVIDSFIVDVFNADADISNQHPIKTHRYDSFTYYFGVYFPNKFDMIAWDMRVWYLFSAVMLIVIVFFAYSLLVILKQKRLAEIQNDFINNMTHEFKTPLSSISISADVLADDEIIKEPERFKKYTGIIKEQNKRLQNHVEKVLKMSSIDSNKIELNKTEIKISEFVQNVINDFKTSIVSFKANIVTDFITPDKIIQADPLHFSNVIINILDNSYKYSDSEPQIFISIKEHKNKLLLTISDNGIGIAKEHIKKIFKKFYRVPTGDIHNVKGFGLGLNYVYNIVKAHKWKITVNSKINEGTVFEVIIPNYLIK